LRPGRREGGNPLPAALGVRCLRVRYAACTTDAGAWAVEGVSTTCMGRVRDLLFDESGQDFVEYGIALAIIALGAAAAAVVIADDVGAIWQACLDTIQAVVGG